VEESGVNSAVRPRTSSARATVACLAALLAANLAPGLATGVRAESRWFDERAAGPFVLHANFSLHPHGSLVQEMARLQRDLAYTLGISEPREQIHLFLFEHKDTYQRYIGRYFPSVPYRRALFIKERGPGMVFAYRSRDFEVDVRHESTHALLHAALPMVPLWLDEGLAEYFEVSPRQRAFENPHLSAVQWSVRVGERPQLEALENIHDLKDMGRDEYRRAWAWTHFMLHGPREAHDELVRFLADIAAHTPPGHLSERLRRRLPDLEARFLDHFRRWKR
jgi:hypothetical protein